MQERHRVRRLAIVGRRRARRVGRALGLAAALGIIALSSLAGAASPVLRLLGAIWVLALTFIVVSPLFLGARAIARLARRRFGGRLYATPTRNALVLGDGARTRWAVPWSDVGVVWRSAPRRIELLTASGDEALLTFQTAAQASEAVAVFRAHARERKAYSLALETDAGRIARELFAWTTPALLMPLAAVFGPLAWPMAPLSLVLGWALAPGERRITLGADGLVLERDGNRRYLAYRDISKVALGRRFLARRSLRLRLDDGRSLQLGRRLEATRASLLASLLEEGLEMVERGEAAGPSAAALATDATTPRAWLAKLEAAAKETGYRTPSLDAERLLSIVRNPAADASQRIAAALTLRAEPSGLARVRVAAEVSTEPEVREALEAIGADTLDEARVARVLERLAQPRR